MGKGFKVYFTKQKLTMCCSLQCLTEAAERHNKQRQCLNDPKSNFNILNVGTQHTCNICEFYNRATLPDGI